MNYLRDTREKSFLINDEYINGYAKLCGINATGVYISLCRHVDKKQTCFPSKRLIAEELSISERSVYTALKTLAEWNIITIEDQGRKKDGSFKSKIYTLINKTNWKGKTPQANGADGKSPQANGAVGRKRRSPQANDDTHRRQEVPNKETHNKETHNKETQSFVQTENTFDIFWNHYPIKKGKPRAIASWSKLKPSPELVKTIIEDISKRQKEDRQWVDGFIQHPTTYLNNRGWEDEITKPKNTNTLISSEDKVDNNKFLNIKGQLITNIK